MNCVIKYQLWILIFCFALSGASICQVNVTAVEPKDGVSITEGDIMDLMTCPGPLDPKEYTDCCYTPEEKETEDEAETEEDLKAKAEEVNNGQPRCCAPKIQPVGIFYIDDRSAMIIALTVTAICVIITAIIIVCCFWSRCPLYTACRIRYHQEDIIAYASKEETAGLNDMPPEETNGVTIYSPNAIKVTLKDDV